MTALGDRLKALAAEKNVSTENLAKAAGIDANTVNEIFRGEIARPPDERLRGFAKALGVSFEDLLNLIPRGLREAGAALLEATAPRLFLIRAIRAGLSGNGNFYPDQTLRQAAPLFDGARVFVKGDAEHLAGGGKDFRNLIGRLIEPVFVEGQGTDAGEIRATLEVLDSAGDIAARLREAVERGMTGLFGFSIDALGSTEIARVGGRRVRRATKLTEIKSVDLIVEPGAGGQLINFVESQKGETMDYLTSDQIAASLRESKLPDYAQRRIADDFTEAEITEHELKEAIAKERAYLANASDSGTVQGLGDASRVELIEGRDEKVAKMLDVFFDPDDSSVISIRESYREITGDTRFTGLTRNCDQALLRESLASASFPQVLGDSIARRMIAEYNLPDQFGVWRQAASVVPVGDFRTQERTRFGGYGDIPIVAEGDPYAAVASPTDEKATYAVTKRGGTEDVTLEMIANDDAGAIQRIPQRLAMAAKRTLSKFVLDILRTNPVIYDGLTLFNASHGNLGTAALDAVSVAAGRLAMKSQTELNSAEKLGIGPRFLWVPDDLEEGAVDLFRRNTQNDKTFLQSLSLDVVPVWYWTDTNDWLLTAPTSQVPLIEVGFFQGQQEPALFVQDSPTLGSMFTHDKTTYKIRHIYGATVEDFRGAYKAVVA